MPRNRTSSSHSCVYAAFHTDTVNKVGTEGTQPGGKAPLEDQICRLPSTPSSRFHLLVAPGEEEIGSTIFSEVKYLSGRT